jgi:hypothetical protein
MLATRTLVIVPMRSPWLLLIYTVPAEPTRKRAHVWREVKKLGAIYLRDGVCALPERPDTLAAVKTLAAAINDFEGQATVVTGATLGAARTDSLEAQFRSARAEEYADVASEAEQLLAHITQERGHRAFTFSEVEELEQDLIKLKRWLEQIQARDYFSAGSDQRALDLLRACDEALAECVDAAAQREGSAR